MKKYILLIVAVFYVATTISAQSDLPEANYQKQTRKSHTDSLKVKQTVGVAIDLLPPIMSMISGNFGYSAQLWYGYKKIRIRGVIAGFTMPDKLIDNEDYKDLNTTAKALIFDYFLKNNFEGWWYGVGIEMWDNTITSKMNNQDYDLKNYVATSGSGYIFKVYKNFYVEPWGAVHYVLNDRKITVGETEYKTKKFQGEISLKVGWHF
ncbi:MAG: hypothetical protein A2X19_10805 [Bacteroidetes bacterium GWE2_39_28]|nr:MAG: hypothetical protein A2X19_10805 [Bacteroidetes bacterium GWE2_39_28]OFY13513.1 MAG: hypothetical protein A2X16_07575 [Bacteroidetes bacterium GWF2_39_10]OFZ06682.1 MAG: hypothetical protein A2322_06825 [Bacteroidetes bacterium RIFOXYB2_FULL_39_7]OFZ11674.1 MAG: hypothetical protein A2465_05580 [Bacteroidetes bacterium RIFOXYC2_FULL_39_11]HCT94846.1 hypothetical protein [Rikenellaceae bacterium]